MCSVERLHSLCAIHGTKTQSNIGKKQKHFICDTTRKLLNLSMNDEYRLSLYAFQISQHRKYTMGIWFLFGFLFSLIISCYRLPVVSGSFRSTIIILLLFVCILGSQFLFLVSHLSILVLALAIIFVTRLLYDYMC